MRSRGANRFRRAAGWTRHAFRPGAIILLYHRVASADRDSWTLSVSPEHFSEHLDVLGRRCHPISLSQLGSYVRAGRVPRRAVVVTFDDGYADNLYEARPLLERFDVPATVFVTASSLHGDIEYWWDELERIVHAPAAAATLARCLNRPAVEGTLAPGMLYQTLWRSLQPLSWTERRAMLDRLHSCVAAPPSTDAMRRPMTDQELARLSGDHLIEVGGHTVGHPLLPSVPIPLLEEEIAGGKAHLEAVLDTRLTTFSYPFGAGGPPGGPVEQAVRSAGFTVACTNQRGTLRSAANPCHLPRYIVEDWTGDEFARELWRWQLD